MESLTIRGRRLTAFQNEDIRLESLTIHSQLEVAGGLMPRQALDQFGKVQMLDVVFPTSDGRRLTMSRYTQGYKGLKLLMARMNKEFGAQSPPKLTTCGQDIGVDVKSL